MTTTAGDLPGLRPLLACAADGAKALRSLLLTAALNGRQILRRGHADFGVAFGFVVPKRLASPACPVTEKSTAIRMQYVPSVALIWFRI